MAGRCFRPTTRIRRVSTTSPACCRSRLHCWRIICPRRGPSAAWPSAIPPSIRASKHSSFPKLLVQDDRMSEDLPFGSQGGAADSLSFPARRRVHHQSSLEAAGIRLPRRHGRAAPDRHSPGWRAAQAIHGGRRGQGHDDARELRREHAGRSRIRGLHAHRRRRSRGARSGEGGRT